MIDMLEALMKGDHIYPAALVAAKIFWDKFFQAHADDDSKAFQKAIDDAQLPFEWALADVGLSRPFAKSLFTLTCVGSLYNDGFDDQGLAERAVLAIGASGSLSIEVKGAAAGVANLYHLAFPTSTRRVA